MIIIVTHAFIVNTLPETYVPLGLAEVPNASIEKGIIEGCGTKRITSKGTTKLVEPVPTTLFASVYVTVSGIFTFPVTLAKFGLSVNLSITKSVKVDAPAVCALTKVNGVVGFAGF